MSNSYELKLANVFHEVFSLYFDFPCCLSPNQHSFPHCMNLHYTTLSSHDQNLNIYLCTSNDFTFDFRKMEIISIEDKWNQQGIRYLFEVDFRFRVFLAIGMNQGKDQHAIEAKHILLICTFIFFNEKALSTHFWKSFHTCQGAKYICICDFYPFGTYSDAQGIHMKFIQSKCAVLAIRMRFVKQQSYCNYNK